MHVFEVKTQTLGGWVLTWGMLVTIYNAAGCSFILVFWVEFLKNILCSFERLNSTINILMILIEKKTYVALIQASCSFILVFLRFSLKILKFHLKGWIGTKMTRYKSWQLMHFCCLLQETYFHCQWWTAKTLETLFRN